jgi:23S rRNA (uracil1939-C5)-methyltransferase
MTGDSMQIRITDLSTDGRGIGRTESGQVVFVEGALTGDLAEVELYEDAPGSGKKEAKRGSSLLKGRAVRIIEPSPDRVENDCPYFRDCGGCTLRELRYEAQLSWKESYVRSVLTRIAGLKDPVVRPIQGMEQPSRYRNKVEFAVENGIPGFYGEKSHRLVPIEDCLLQDEAITKQLRKEMEALSRHCSRMTIRCSHPDGSGEPENTEIMVIKEYDDGNITASCRVLHDLLQTEMADIKTEISPMSFYQVNSAQTTKLYSIAQRYAALTGNERVLDLYCGAGTIGLSMASKAARVIGVEVNKQAILDANRNAVINGIVNATFVQGKAEDAVNTKLQGVQADVVILDPPRSGCKESLLRTVADIGPERIVYVSCNPSTLARDIKILNSLGYSFIECTPVDMFPHSSHVETVCCLYHQKKDFISVPYKPRNADYLKRSSRSAVGNRGDDKL